MKVVPPLFVLSDDLCSFASVDVMVKYIEPIDATDIRVAFDSEGRRLHLATEDVKTTGRWIGGGRIWLESVGPESDSESLDTMLREYLGHRYTNEALASLDHAALVDAAAREFDTR